MSRSKNKGPKVVPMTESDDTNVAVAEPEAPKSEKSTALPPRKKNVSFYDNVRAIPKDDWGKRAFIYGYCIEPLCNLKASGENKYLFKSGAPIFDEDGIMHDYGSGVYRLNLVYRKPAGDKGDEVDSYQFEIYNPKYPPKIPRAVWMNDPRNERWAALLPKEEPAVQPTGAGVLLESMKVVNEIRRDAREENPPALPPAPPPNRIGEFTEMINAVKSVMPAPPPAATDNKVLDTVMALMTKQIDTSAAEVKELRGQVFQLLTQKQENKGGDNLESIIDKFEKIAPKIQGILGLGGEKLTDVVHGRRRGFWEELALKAVEELAPGVNSFLTAGGQFLLAPKGGQLQIGGPQATQAALPAPNGNGQPQQQADPLLPLKQKVGNFLGANLRPLQKHFEAYVKGELRDPDDKENGVQDGSDFAMWIEENHGVEILTDARTLGADQITLMFQSTPAIWAAIKPHEQKFKEFLYQVLAYTPDEQPVPDDEGKPVDLTEVN